MTLAASPLTVRLSGALAGWGLTMVILLLASGS